MIPEVCSPALGHLQEYRGKLVTEGDHVIARGLPAGIWRLAEGAVQVPGFQVILYVELDGSGLAAVVPQLSRTGMEGVSDVHYFPFHLDAGVDPGSRLALSWCELLYGVPAP